MNEIFLRRSIRKYTEEEIADEILHQILKAGMNAPTAKNLKPFEFVVVRNKEKLQQLTNASKYSRFLKDSNVTIVVLGRELSDYWQQDLGAVTQNILLQATSFNIGSCWIGMAPNENNEEYARRILGIPNDVRVFSMITLGYMGENKDKNDNYYEDRVHYDKY